MKLQDADLRLPTKPPSKTFHSTSTTRPPQPPLSNSSADLQRQGSYVPAKTFSVGL